MVIIFVVVIISAAAFAFTYPTWIRKEASITPKEKMQEFILSGGGNISHTPQKEIYREEFERPEYLKDSDILWLYVSEPDKISIVFDDEETVLKLGDYREHFINGWIYKVVYEEVSGWVPSTGRRVYIYPSIDHEQYENAGSFVIKSNMGMTLRIAHAGKSDYEFTWDERENGQGKEISVSYCDGRVALSKKK